MLGILTKSLFDKNNYSDNSINETKELMEQYSNLPHTIDSLEKISIYCVDTANIELLHYVLEYNGVDDSQLPDYYITNFGDTIEYNKTNFNYYVAMYLVAESLLATRKNIINGLLLNNKLVEQDQKFIEQ